jgi:hypothetical protein
MRKTLTLFFGLMLAFTAQAQIPFVTVTDINYVTPMDLQNCNDTTVYLGDTVRTFGIVVIDGGLSEVASGSVQGGLRPFIHIVDTANGGATDPFASIEVMGVITDANGNLIPHPNFIYVAPGDIVEVVGIVGEFDGSNQLALVDGNSFNVVGSTTAPTPAVVPLGDLNDQNAVNQLPTGEPWEGAYVKLENVTVSEIIYFSGGSRVSFNIEDASGNRLNVSDRYIAQKLPSHQVLNANSPNSTAAGGPGTGTFVVPVPGTFYNSISGVVRQSANGCTGDAGRGYELNPFLDSHYDLGFAPPYIANFERDPLIPTSNQSPDITMNITDFDGTVDSVSFWYTSDPNLTPSQFTQGTIGLVAGTTDEYETTIPNFPDGTLVRYYIYAEDNDGNGSYLPSKPLNQTEPNFSYYTVRDNGLIIPDIQFTLNSNGSSPFSGETVTVTGYATSSTKQFDLGYVYIQDPNYSEWAGIALRGTNQLTDVFRGEEVTVTGQVVESFGFTMIDVLSLTRTGNVMNIPPVSIDPADSAAYASGEIEKYEGMLVRAELAGSQVWITEENLGFGDYAISSEQGAPLQRSMRVLAGRQSNTAQSSLYASLVTDTFYVNADGIMEVPAITVSDTMNMDAVIGLLSYGFSNYRILPRNNDDFVNINVPLDSTDLVGSPFSIEEINSIPGVSVYPNPNNGSFRIGMESVRPMEYRLLDFQGRLLRKGSISRNGQEIQAFDLPSGLYFLLLEDSATEITAIEKIIIRK